MIRENTIKLSLSYAIASKVKDYAQLMKFTLSFLVVFSSVIGFLMVPGVGFNVGYVLLLFIAGLMVTGSANTINQIMEKDTDALMARTAKRPLPDGRMKTSEAWVFSIILGIAGVLIMAIAFNILSAILSLFSLIMYGLVYTPWKKKNSLAVLIGAVPGALPPLIGWAAGAGALTAGGWSLFAIQFVWQFPHFWAIAWVAYDDYQKAGFKLLPSGQGRNKFTALQAVMYTVMLIPVGLLPYFLHITGMVAAVVVTLTGIFLLLRAMKLYKFCDVKSARGLMFGSYIYLMIVLLVLLANKV